MKNHFTKKNYKEKKYKLNETDHSRFPQITDLIEGNYYHLQVRPQGPNVQLSFHVCCCCEQTVINFHKLNFSRLLNEKFSHQFYHVIRYSKKRTLDTNLRTYDDLLKTVSNSQFISHRIIIEKVYLTWNLRISLGLPAFFKQF